MAELRTGADEQPSLLDRALARAENAHANQFDRDDRPHIEHVIRVAERTRECAPETLRDDAVIAAYLHDTIEDSGETQVDLLRDGFPADAVHAVSLVTRIADEHDRKPAYNDYVRTVAVAPGRAGEIARLVKRSDLEDNLRRCEAAADPAADRYRQALAILDGYIPSDL
ncbi:MAG TPA: HD domain-containing protein [Thermoleophilia bacterium]|nr:HD domain-containing protein [Thermoleophilia bacterium]